VRPIKGKKCAQDFSSYSLSYHLRNEFFALALFFSLRSAGKVQVAIFSFVLSTRPIHVYVVNMVTMHRNSWLRVLLLFGLCSTLLAAVVLPVSSDPDCPYEYLPDSLDTLSGLGFNGELNIHNEYYTPFVRGQNHAITFTLTQPSAFRIYIEPHYVDIDIWLYKDSTSIAVCFLFHLLNFLHITFSLQKTNLDFFLFFIFYFFCLYFPFSQYTSTHQIIR
jgi:hypothetical protein